MRFIFFKPLNTIFSKAAKSEPIRKLNPQIKGLTLSSPNFPKGSCSMPNMKRKVRKYTKSIKTIWIVILSIASVTGTSLGEATISVVTNSFFSTSLIFPRRRMRTMCPTPTKQAMRNPTVAIVRPKLVPPMKRIFFIHVPEIDGLAGSLPVSQGQEQPGCGKQIFHESCRKQQCDRHR